MNLKLNKLQQDLLKKTEEVEKINSERVFSIQNQNDEFWLVEECDEYFFHELTKQDCLELSELFAEIAKLIKE